VKTGGDGFITVLNWSAAFFVLAGLYMALVFAPVAANLATETERLAQRILYFHVGAAWVGFLAFFVTFVASIVYLARREQFWDMVGLSSVELGTLFLTMVLVTGSLWARPTWNTWWTWDPRLTISAVTWLLYIAYLLLRGAVDDPARRARFSAVFGIVAFITVPLNFMAIRWWRTIHPVVVGSGSSEAIGGFALSPRMTAALLFCVVAFTVVYADLLVQRVRLERAADEVQRLRHSLLQRGEQV
jgi:heme exporter protein C